MAHLGHLGHLAIIWVMIPSMVDIAHLCQAAFTKDVVTKDVVTNE